MKIFMTGATGYIGGSVAARLLDLGHEIVGLVRSEQSAEKLRVRGMRPLLGDLASHGLIVRAAREADAVINSAQADDPFPVASILIGLEGSGKRFIHTSGTSVVGDMAAGEYSAKVFNEDTPYDPLPGRAQRVAVQKTVLAAAARGVHSVVLCPPLIYGRGHGANPDSAQIPKLIRLAEANGMARYIGKGENVWSNVHIDDVVTAYVLALEHAPAGSFFYLQSGEASMKAANESIGRLLGVPTGSWSIDEAASALGAQAAWFSFGSNSRVDATKARRMLGWNPQGPGLFHEIERGCYAAARG
jgi:nucleoside-diphosphate-sugar epimerase